MRALDPSGASVISARNDSSGSWLELALIGTNNSQATLFGSSGAGRAYVDAPTDLTIGTDTANYLALGTANVEHLRIDPQGRVGIGTTAPQSSLQIAGYLQLDLTAGQPPGPDCTASTRGRMKFDDSSNLLWICGSSGWVSK